jgi:hypothetical protein
MPADSLLSKLFRAFEGNRSAYPIAIFRVAFFSGLALHFFPSMIYLDDSYAPGALRTDEWSHWLYTLFTRVPHSTLRVWSIATMIACGMAIVGVMPRFSVTVSALGFYAFASFNGFPVQTLALVDAWAILLAWMICGGGTEALSIDALLRKRRGEGKVPVAPKLLSALVLYQVLLAVFFSGIEKLIAGWPWTNEMGILMSYPKGFLIRDWVASSAWMHSPVVTNGLSWSTLVIELGCPIALLFGSTRVRVVALVAFQAFFLGIITMLEVPPLFYCIFAFGALLALRDHEIDQFLTWVGRVRAVRSSRGSAPSETESPPSR